jgi:hypothetical protein
MRERLFFSRPKEKSRKQANARESSIQKKPRRKAGALVSGSYEPMV